MTLRPNLRPFHVYQVTYLRTNWSQHYEIDHDNSAMMHPTGEVTIDCGRWSTPEEFLETVVPGTYLFTPVQVHPTTLIHDFPATFVVTVGAPDAQDYPRIVADTL